MADMVEDARVAIKNYFDIVVDSYNGLADGAGHAHDDFIGQIAVHTEETLRNLITAYNRDKASGGFLTDLIMSVVLGPLLGHLFELGMKKMFSASLKTLERDESVIRNLKKDVVEGRMKLEGRDKVTQLENLRRDLKTVKAKKDLYEITPRFINDTIQQVVPESVKKLNRFDSDTNISAIKDMYTKQTVANYSAAIGIIRDKVYAYVAMQNSFNELWRETYNKLVNVFKDDEEIISEFKKHFENRLELLGPRGNYKVIIKEQYQEILEAFFWILYFGKPTKWKSDETPEYKFEKLDLKSKEAEYVVTQGGRDPLGQATGYNVSPMGADYGTWIKAEEKGGGGVRGMSYSKVPDLYVYRLKFNIPRGLIHYLVTRFRNNFGKLTFHDSVKDLKQKVMGRSSGYGIDTAQPVTKSQMESLSYADVNYVNLASPYIAPTDYAGVMLISWFKQIDEQMTANNTFSKIFEGKELGTMEKNFELSLLSQPRSK